MDKKKILIKIKRIINKEIHVTSVYLFGSRARNTYTKDSDYDIAIISPQFKGKSFLDRQQFTRPLLRKALGAVPIDVACYTPAEFKKGSAFLPGIIKKEGICI